MSVREYIGARYVPLFANPIEWDNTKTYEPLTIVYYQGNSYTSRQAVPTGIAITNETYWALTGNYNAQIEQYRQEVLAFEERIADIEETVSDMVQKASNYSIGDYVETRGYYTPGDGGNGLYIIDSISNQTPNGLDIINLNDTICAVLIGNLHNPASYGADTTGVRDSASAINRCIQNNPKSEVLFYPGVYIVNSPINTPFSENSRTNINFNGSLIVANAQMDYLLGIGGNSQESSGLANTSRTFFKNGNLLNQNGNASVGVFNNDYYKNANLESMNIEYFDIGVKVGSSNASPSDMHIIDCMIRNNKTNDITTIGVQFNGTDNEISDCRIYGFGIAIQMNGSSLICNTIHTLPYGEYTTAECEITKFIEVNADGFRLDDCYCDTQGIFIDVTIPNIYTGIVNSCNMHSFITPMQMIFAKLQGNGEAHIIFNDCIYDPRLKRDNTKNTSIVFGANNNSQNLKSLVFNNCRIAAPTNAYSGDLFSTREKQSSFWPNNTYDGWMPIACFVLPNTANKNAIDFTLTRNYSTPRTIRIVGKVDGTNASTAAFTHLHGETSNFSENIACKAIETMENVTVVVFYTDLDNTIVDYHVVNNGLAPMTSVINIESYLPVANAFTNHPELTATNLTTIYTAGA